MSTKSPADNSQPFFVFCGLLLVTAFLYWAQKVLIPVALAILLAFILTPLVSALQRRGLGRVFSALLVVTLAFALLGAAGWVLSLELSSLVKNREKLKTNIYAKIDAIRGQGNSGFFADARGFFSDISKRLVEPDTPDTPNGEPVKPGDAPEHPVYIKGAPSELSRFAEAIGPAAEGLADTFLVVVLVIFMLIQRESLRNRVVRLIGHGRLITTTRAMDEGAQRISRYLLMQLCINSAFGAALAVGLFVLGLVAGQPGLYHYALLWGFLAGALRFVPYLGTWLAAGLIFLFNMATLPGWTLTLLVLAYFILLELVTANAVEPLLFGHSTGVSPVALLLAAAFWTWLWGPVGLLLSTPLTVILVVLGKYAPQLKFLEVLLGDEPALRTDVTFYQRLLAHDQDEATDLVEEYLQTHSVESAFEDVLLPTLILAKRDHQREDLDADDLQFVHRVIRDIVDELAPLQAPPPARVLAGQTKAPPPPALILGCPARDETDELALEIFRQLLRPAGYEMEVISSKVLSAEMLERVGNVCPSVVLIASLPPGGLAQARYLCKRMHGQCSEIKILVGRWGETENVERMQKRLQAAGAAYVGTTLAETRTQIVPLLQVAAAPAPPADDRPAPELAHH